ncbi:MAG: AEC family transporter [Oscillospiraceae bacterium]|nr:AEC family transporter [Oscillospiraceae bacterium]
MDIAKLLSLQGTLFAMMLVGALMKRRGVIDEGGKRCLSDLCINVVIPCNIFRSCLIEMDSGILRTCGLLLFSALLMQILCLLLNRYLFNRYPPQRKKVLQYCTIVPMSGFLGNPIAEGLYDRIGVLYTSIFLIPMRVVMWSVGTTYFTAQAEVDRRKVIKNVLTHPCLVAIYLGLFCTLTALPLPTVLTETVRYIGNCNSALTMFIVGTILAEVEPRALVNKDACVFSILRLLLLPLAAYGIGLLLGLDRVSLGVSTLMSGMPAGATAAIFAARYESDAHFATKCVVISTLLSMLTLPFWGWLVG